MLTADAGFKSSARITHSPLHWLARLFVTAVPCSGTDFGTTDRRKFFASVTIRRFRH
jgi:hypothetical protein